MLALLSAAWAAPKRHRAGTHRVEAPERTLGRIRPLLPAMGVTRIANVTGLDCIGLPVVMVCRPNSRSLAVHQGKGLDLTAAKVSGAMEAVECFHAEHITLPLRLASLADLGGRLPLVDLEDLPRRDAGRFSPRLRIAWIEGRDLLGERRSRWLPYELVHADYTLPLPSGSGCFLATSNGLASGNCTAEAISHALSEVIERDARALWWLRSEDEQRATALELASVDDADCVAVLARLEQAGIATTVWDITSDVMVPSFLCRIAEAEGSPRPCGGGFYGAGTHPARGIALLRALTEAAQSRLTKIAGSRDDLAPEHYEGYARFEREVFARMAPAAGQARRHFQAEASFEGDSLDEDVAWQLSRLEAAGIRQAAVVDLTKPEFGIPVVRVVVPGLEGMHTKPGYAPGRRARALLRAAAP